MDDRLTRLEVLFSEQGRMLEDLSAEMYQQQQDVIRLKLQIQKLEEKLAASTESNTIGGHERLPHY
jgi:uncharacterized coiled-coil protein SlyX